MKKFVLMSILMIMIIPVNAFSGEFQFGLAASADVLAADVEASMKQEFGSLCFGAGLLHHDEDYSIGNVKVALKTERLTPEVRYSLGFNGLFGKVDTEHGHFDGDLAAVGFWFGVDYELKSTMNPLNIPVEISADACFAPDSMSFEDSSQYFGFRGGAKFWILENACIYLACQYTDIEFETSSNGNWDRDDTIFLGGIRLRL